VVSLKVPPLRERREDIPLLARHFLRLFSAQAVRPVREFTPAAMAALERYAWPGNVRELENVVDRAVALATGTLVEESDLPEALQNGARAGRSAPRRRQPLPDASGRHPSLEEVTNRYVRQVLDETEGNKTRAAQVLGVPRRTLYRMLARMNAGVSSEE
jgi:DNA-binding NtrC family response regulator